MGGWATQMGVLGDVSSGVRSWWAPILAFAAGVVSFASPCVLPLVPGYLSFVAGDRAGASNVANRGAAATARRPVAIAPILLFILGFTIVFTVLFGFTASALSRWLKSSSGQRAAGAVVLAFGAFMLLYALRRGGAWLYREERPFLSRVRPGPAAALPLGMAFAVGWTPCIGPVFGAILTLAARQGSTARTVGLLLAYSLGLGVPFLLIGLGVERLMGAFRFFSRNYGWFAGVSGAILVAIGVLLVAGEWTRLVNPLFQFANRVHLPI
jgi:cytochrome c-type biogenesis protein